MKFYGQSEQVANRVLTIFEHPELLPAAVAPVFIHSKAALPCNAWSYRNRVLCAIAGTHDARGFQQWKEVGRSVKKGAKAFHILAPCYIGKEDKNTEEKRQVLIGFRSVPVFRIEDTEGAPIESTDPELEHWIDNLPLVEVARAWGMQLETYNGAASGAQGWFSPTRNKIALGVTNVSTFLHELMHAADHRLGNLVERGQHWRSETVAEFGAATLAACIGLDENAIDIGGAYRYVAAYAKAAEKTPTAAAMDCLDRICQAINLILTTAEEINAAALVEIAA